MSAMALASPPDSDIGRSPPGSRPPGMPKVNSNTENLLRGSFEAYGDGGGTAGGGRMGSSGWQAFCAECKLAEGNLTMQRLDMIFGGHATPGPGGRALSYDHFLMALAQVCPIHPTIHPPARRTECLSKMIARDLPEGAQASLSPPPHPPSLSLSSWHPSP